MDLRNDCMQSDLCSSEVTLKILAEMDTLVMALQKIYDPRTYHHLEPDSYTQAGCFQFVAQEALKEVGVIDLLPESQLNAQMSDKP